MKITKVLVEDENGTVTNITDLPIEEYEKFMDIIHDVRLMYIALKEEEDKGKLADPKAE